MDGETRADGVVIDLTKRLDVRELKDKSELIQQQALASLANLITRRLVELESMGMASPSPEDIDADGSNILFDRRHDTIIIHGSRGSGKTTFIRNAFRLFRKDQVFNESIGRKIAPLGVVDPTLIENKENLFVVVLNKIKRAVERKRQAYGDWKPSGDDFNVWQEKLRSLAQGLSLLDQIGPDKALGDSWDDVQYVLRKGLEKASAGSDLETKFHEFIDCSLAYLGKQAFLMALDDIDTDFRRGWPVLEMLRRYLTSPRFIIVLSGDLDLYTLLVRGKQWDQFSKRQLHHDTSQEKGLLEMVNHLQGQYMLKVLPPKNRIPLLTLDSMDDVRVIPPDGGAPEPLDRYMRTLVRQGLGMRGSIRRRTTALLLRQPVRTVLQLLSHFRVPPAGAMGGYRAPWHDLVNGLPSIFLDSLLRHNTSLDELRQATGSRTVGFVAKFLTENELWDNAHNLVPEHTDDDRNLVLITISAWLRGQCLDRPGLALDYMLRICFGHELLSNRLQGLTVVNFNDDDEPLELSEFVRFTELERYGSSVEVVRRLIAVINGDEVSGIRLGTVQTYKRDARLRSDTVALMYGRSIPDDGITFTTYAPAEGSPLLSFYKAMRSRFEDESFGETPVLIGNWYNTIDSLQARLTSEMMKALTGLPVCRILKPNGERPTFVSVHSIIAGISELLRRSRSGGDDEVVRALRDACLIRAYPTPPWISKTPNDPTIWQPEERDPYDDDAEMESIIGDPLFQRMMQWIKQQPETLPVPPPYVLARVWGRFYFSLAAIDEEIERKDRFLGGLLHRQIVAFLNSLLVEELRYLRNDKVILKNPITVDNIFVSNMQFAEDAPFFNFIFGCPLWSAYLDPESEAGKRQCRYAFLEDKPAALSVMYDVRQISRHESRLDLEEGRRRVLVSFANLYPLLNSVPVVGVAVKADSDQGVQPARRSRRRIKGVTRDEPKPD
ncbi:hypothetical protein [Azospirillum sp.]|uniref:hypothetical protein n=1 Tax=Azospirillum sp. TaxID=34012 RepID=UPI003D7419CB